MQQLREAWPSAAAPKFLLFDRDSKFGSDVISAAREIGSQPVCTAFRSPWQNGVAERWVGSCRQDLLDHVIVMNERHLKRLISEYVRYYHEDRTHLGLAKDTPAGRPIGTAHRVEARFDPFLDSVACIIATQWLRRSAVFLTARPQVNCQSRASHFADGFELTRDHSFIKDHVETSML